MPSLKRQRTQQKKECLLKMNELARDIVTPHEICGGGDSNDDGKIRLRLKRNKDEGYSNENILNLTTLNGLKEALF